MMQSPLQKRYVLQQFSCSMFSTVEFYQVTSTPYGTSGATSMSRRRRALEMKRRCGFYLLAAAFCISRLLAMSIIRYKQL